ncbi:LysR family transcriptional regulator [Pseudomonas sp. NPDC090202]|uniref:LysR family transcriptional regulator n=1 Tax=Pseudomonas sp. NPDC090202 TaxID=3364476 RepID=UPI003820D066
MKEEKRLRDVDLNLLVTFIVLFREQSVSKTAEHFSVTQPAVSMSLARLRERFDDPLFVRTGKGVRPTKRATEIAERLLPAMMRIASVMGVESSAGYVAGDCPDAGMGGVNSLYEFFEDERQQTFAF